MISSRLSQQGQGAITPMSIAVFFLFYFTFIMVLVWMVEGIPPMFLTTDVTWLAIGSATLVVGAMLIAEVTERSYAGLTFELGGAPISAWHIIRFGILAAIEFSIGWPLYNAVTKSAMFEFWLLAIFVYIPFIVFTIAMYQIIMGGGGA